MNIPKAPVVNGLFEHGKDATGDVYFGGPILTDQRNEDHLYYTTGPGYQAIRREVLAEWLRDHKTIYQGSLEVGVTTFSMETHEVEALIIEAEQEGK